MKKTPYKVLDFDEFNYLVAEMQSLVEDVNELRAKNKILERRFDLIDAEKQRKIDAATEKYRQQMKQHQAQYQYRMLRDKQEALKEEEKIQKALHNICGNFWGK